MILTAGLLHTQVHIILHVLLTADWNFAKSLPKKHFVWHVLLHLLAWKQSLLRLLSDRSIAGGSGVELFPACREPRWLFQPPRLFQPARLSQPPRLNGSELNDGFKIGGRDGIPTALKHDRLQNPTLQIHKSSP